MADFVTFTLHEARSRAHRHNNGFVQPAFKTCSQAIGNKLIDLLGRYAIDILIDVCRTDARDHHLLHVGQLDAVVVQKLAESTIKRRHLIGSSNADGRNDTSFAQSDNLRGRYAHVNTYNHSHNLL